MKKVLLIGLALAFHTPVQPLADAGQLRDAAKEGNLEKVKSLLDSGVSVNDPEPATTRTLRSEKLAEAHEVTTARTPLHYAAMQGHTAVARLLIERGANVNATAWNEWSSRVVTGAGGRAARMSTVMQTMAGLTPLYFAAESGHAEMVRLLIEKGAEVNAQVVITHRDSLRGVGPSSFKTPADVAKTSEIRQLLENEKIRQTGSTKP